MRTLRPKLTLEDIKNFGQKNSFNLLMVNICRRLDYSMDKVICIVNILESRSGDEFKNIFDATCEATLKRFLSKIKSSKSRTELIEFTRSYLAIDLFLVNPQAESELTFDIYDTLDVSIFRLGFDFLSDLVKNTNDRLECVLECVMEDQMLQEFLVRNTSLDRLTAAHKTEAIQPVEPEIVLKEVVIDSNKNKQVASGQIVKVENTSQSEVRKDSFDIIIESICNLLKYGESETNYISKLLLDNSRRGDFQQFFSAEVVSVYDESIGKLIQPKLDYWTLLVYLNNPVNPKVTPEIYNKIMDELIYRNSIIMGKNENLAERVYSFETFEMLVANNTNGLKITLNRIMRKVLVQLGSDEELLGELVVEEDELSEEEF